jgi:aminopeptidase
MKSKKEHQELLKKYAEAVVRVGLNLREGQRLIITNATARGVPPAGREFVHEATKAAYAAGARYVEVIWGDEEILRIRLQNAPADSFDEYPTWQINAVMNMIEKGDALLSVSANDPDIYQGLDSERVNAMQMAHVENYAPISTQVSRNAINWCVVAAASPAWAAKVFPDLQLEEAEEKLWQAIFETTRAMQPAYPKFEEALQLYAGEKLFSPALSSPRYRLHPRSATRTQMDQCAIARRKRSRVHGEYAHRGNVHPARSSAR